jgi:hypothetical protein
MTLGTANAAQLHLVCGGQGQPVTVQCDTRADGGHSDAESAIAACRLQHKTNASTQYSPLTTNGHSFYDRCYQKGTKRGWLSICSALNPEGLETVLPYKTYLLDIFRINEYA